MKIMNISLSINVADAKHRKALNDFMEALSEEKSIVEETVKPKRARTKKKEETEEKEVETTEAKQAPSKEEVKEAEEVPAVDLIMLRTKVSEIVKKDGEKRLVIKSKLGDLGSVNVSQLDESKYDEFNDYLDTL